MSTTTRKLKIWQGTALCAVIGFVITAGLIYVGFRPLQDPHHDSFVAVNISTGYLILWGALSALLCGTIYATGELRRKLKGAKR